VRAGAGAGAGAGGENQRTEITERSRGTVEKWEPFPRTTYPIGYHGFRYICSLDEGQVYQEVNV
jgi:hypothetical protein